MPFYHHTVAVRAWLHGCADCCMYGVDVAAGCGERTFRSSPAPVAAGCFNIILQPKGQSSPFMRCHWSEADRRAGWRLSLRPEGRWQATPCTSAALASTGEAMGHSRVCIAKKAWYYHPATLAALCAICSLQNAWTMQHGKFDWSTLRRTALFIQT